MTPLTALPIQTGIALPADPAAGLRGEGAETADFSVLLAFQPGAAVPPPVGGTVTAPGSGEAPAEPSDPAILPLPGKVLPPALPPALPPGVSQPVSSPDTAESPAPTETPPPAVQPRIAVPIPVTLRALRSAVVPSGDEPAADNEAPVEPDRPTATVAPELPQPAALPIPQPAAPIQPLVAAIESPVQTPSEPTPEPRAAPTAPAPATTAPIRTLPQPAPVPVSAPPQPAVTVLTAATLPVQPVAVTLKVRPGRTVEVAGSQATSSPALPTAELPLVASEPTRLRPSVVASEPNPVQAAIPSLPVSEPAARPHDFAALVDRLTAAREAVQPQAVSIAVAHRDFGPVRLQFRHEDGVLSVALASADPDFARAVAAAPPIQAPAATEAGSFQPGRNSSDSASSNSGQSRSGTNTAAREDRTPQGNPSSARKPRRDGDHQQGIFA